MDVGVELESRNDQRSLKFGTLSFIVIVVSTLDKGILISILVSVRVILILLLENTHLMALIYLFIQPLSYLRLLLLVLLRSQLQNFLYSLVPPLCF